jgi:hypothetical protein
MEKQDFHITLIDVRTWIVVKLFSTNANSLIRCNFQLDSIVTDVNDSQYQKHNLNKISTDARAWIIFKLFHLNVDSSIHCNFEFDSNAIDVIDLQS